jgi:hypothetical protein
VAIIGEGMAFRPGTGATFTKAMANAGVNIRAIAQVLEHRKENFELRGLGRAGEKSPTHPSHCIGDRKPNRKAPTTAL